MYLIVKGDHKFQLPHKVDIKYEENIDPNPNEIVREYQLVLNRHNHDGTTLQFAERRFKQLDVNYIILLKEFDTNYEDFITKNYSFVMDSRYNLPDLNSKTPLHIYYAFDKIIFMNEWNLVELKKPDDICITRDFRYSTKGLINSKDNFISVLNRTTYASPVLTRPTKRTTQELRSDRLRSRTLSDQRERGSRERSSDLRESAKPTLLKFSPYVDEVKKVPEAKLRISSTESERKRSAQRERVNSLTEGKGIPEPILKPSRFPVDQNREVLADPERSESAEDEELRKRSKWKVYSPGEFMTQNGFPGSAGNQPSILPETSSSESIQDDVEMAERPIRDPLARTNQGGRNIIPEPNNQTGTVWTNPLRRRFTRNNDQSTSKNNSHETDPEASKLADQRERSNRHPTFSHPGRTLSGSAGDRGGKK